MSSEIAMFACPLPVIPRLDSKPWGGRRLAHYGKLLPDGPVGEAVETAPEARVDGGPFDGMTLAELVARAPLPLLGQRGIDESRGQPVFPLLVKLIDASEDLSVQVHPGDADAPSGKRGKCEAWLVLDAAPGARLITGTDGPFSIEDIRQHLVSRSVQPGDTFLVPPGTVHAIGAGVLLYEIQQPSDITYRLYDWDRQREMHVHEGMAVAIAGQVAQPLVPEPTGPGRELLAVCDYFALERLRVGDEAVLPAMPVSCRVLTVIEGRLSLGGLVLGKGRSAVLPADMPAAPICGPATALIASIPEPRSRLQRSVVMQ